MFYVSLTFQTIAKGRLKFLLSISGQNFLSVLWLNLKCKRNIGINFLIFSLWVRECVYFPFPFPPTYRLFYRMKQSKNSWITEMVYGMCSTVYYLYFYFLFFFAKMHWFPSEQTLDTHLANIHTYIPVFLIHRLISTVSTCCCCVSTNWCNLLQKVLHSPKKEKKLRNGHMREKKTFSPKKKKIILSTKVIVMSACVLHVDNFSIFGCVCVLTMLGCKNACSCNVWYYITILHRFLF